MLVLATAGCTGGATTPAEDAPPPLTTPEAAANTETQLSGDQLVRRTGTVVDGGSPGCLLLDTGTTRYILIGGDPEIIEVDAELEVTGNANPETPTQCTGGTPLTVTQVAAVDQP